MIIFYNVLQLIFLPLLAPILILFVLCKPKYRGRILARIGFRLPVKPGRGESKSLVPAKTYWVHALSVGEVTSSIPLIKGLKKKEPDCRVIFSVTTRSGRNIADNLLPGIVDTIIDGPLDILPVILYFTNRIKPDYFILIETDFWPNQLYLFQRKSIPAILVNGRISDKSLDGYRRLPFFFKSLFQSFAALCMQTEADRKKMCSLGVSSTKLHTLGNLKFDTILSLEKENSGFLQEVKRLLPQDRTIVIAGSTHPGEESILIECFLALKLQHPDLFLALAPRDISRTEQLSSLLKKSGLKYQLRSAMNTSDDRYDIFILDSIGELTAFYGFGDICYVGGSLVAKGGHNPIEPASQVLPVIFGPHMEDFSEIADTLVEKGGAIRVRNKQEIITTLDMLLNNKERRISMGGAARKCIEQHQGVIARHLQLIEETL
jgi:3-deoxy-D-manno-octulosonic-acid transferase